MICAFQEGDAQFPCDPGCCLTEETEASASTGTKTATDTSSEPAFPIWAIILLIVLGAIGLAIFVAWAAKKMSRRSSNGG
jgi:flagellar biogenesis protein FliO